MTYNNDGPIYSNLNAKTYIPNWTAQCYQCSNFAGTVPYPQPGWGCQGCLDLVENTAKVYYQYYGGNIPSWMSQTIIANCDDWGMWSDGMPGLGSMYFTSLAECQASNPSSCSNAIVTNADGYAIC